MEEEARELIATNRDDLRELLGRVFDDYWGDDEDPRLEIPPGEYEKSRNEFVFHMMDWKDDLGKIVDLFRSPEEADEKAAWMTIFGFLNHALPHLNAACRLLLGEIPDVFGALKADKPGWTTPDREAVPADESEGPSLPPVFDAESEITTT